MRKFPSGRLPMEVLGRLLGEVRREDPRLVVGGRVGEDAAVIGQEGGRYLIAKSDPVTFAADRPGWYTVQVNANDVAVMGGDCRWFLATVLLPEESADEAMVEELFGDLTRACRELGVQLAGGHTEIAPGLPRPIISGTMLGEAEKGSLCTKDRIGPGDRILLTGALAVEGTAILARDFSRLLEDKFSDEEIRRAAEFLHDPGISVVAQARAARETGGVHAMHDPTEGGLATALRELAEATGLGMEIETAEVRVHDLTARFCDHLGLDPLGLIASGSLLVMADPESSGEIISRLGSKGIECAEIGSFLDPGGGVMEISEGKRQKLRRFERDELCRLF